MATVAPPLEGTFTSTGASDAVSVRGICNILLYFGGAVATVVLEKTHNGTDWYAVSKDTTPSDASYTDNVNAVIEEQEPGVKYRWNCTSFTSGAIVYRIGKGYNDRA